MNILIYIMVNVNKKSDIELIKEFIGWAAQRGLTLEEMARTVKRTKGWASAIIRGQIKELKFSTRCRIESVLKEFKELSL